MDAVKFIEERNRMCDRHAGGCEGCPLYTQPCNGLRTVNPERIVGVVEEWSAAHPRKTRQSVFLEQYPNAKLDSEGVVCICPELVFGETVCAKNCNMICYDCRHKFWPQEVKE